MSPLRRITPQHLVLAITVTLTAAVASGCARYPVPATLRETLEPGSNVLVVERESPTNEEPTPLSFLADARRQFSVQRYELAVDDADRLLLVTRPQQIKDGLAVRLQVHAEPMPDGSRLVGMAEWAPTTTATAWQPARWTTGNERRAFFELIDVLSEINHNRIGATMDADMRMETETR